MFKVATIGMHTENFIVKSIWLKLLQTTINYSRKICTWNIGTFTAVQLSNGRKVSDRERKHSQLNSDYEFQVEPLSLCQVKQVVSTTVCGFSMNL